MTKDKANGKPEQFVPSHGHGRLNRGSLPGHKGGPGRPPSVVRAIAREGYADRLPKLFEIIDDPESKPGEVVAAMALLERTGLATAHEVTGTDGEPIQLAAIARGAAEEFRRRIEALAAVERRLPASERPDPEKAIPDPTPPPRKYDPDEVIATFVDRPPRQEKAEKAEAVVEPEQKPPASRPNGRRPVGAVVSTESLRGRFF